MDEPQVAPEFTSESTVNGDDPPPAQYTSAFFPHAKHFVVAGGTFKSIMNIAPTNPCDFREIPLGDLNLLHKIGLDRESGVIRLRRGHLRQLYSARLHGSPSSMTAVVYQGNDAEKQFREQISLHSELRHPYLLQLYGVVSTAALHAMVFHDDLMPSKELEKKYRGFHFSTAFLWGCMAAELGDVKKYMHRLSGRKLRWIDFNVWIRPSTGHLCIDLSPHESDCPTMFYTMKDFRAPGTSLFKPPEDPEAIISMSLQDYHDICDFHLCRRRYLPASSEISVKLGSIRHFSGLEYGTSFEIASVPDCEVEDRGWSTRDLIVEAHWIPIDCSQEGICLMENGWIRVDSDQAANEYHRRLYANCLFISGWLAQANHIFDCLDITSDFENCVFMEGVQYRLWMSERGAPIPLGYLFLCPVAHLQSDSATFLRIPDCPAYWSLDPSGANRLNAEAAQDLGFPNIEFRFNVKVKSWDESVYAGIRKFHEAKGIVPCSEDAVMALGYPLVQLSCEREDLRVQENESNDDFSSDSDGVSETKDLTESGVEESESERSVNGVASPVQEADIEATPGPNSTQGNFSGNKEILARPHCRHEIDEEYVMNTSDVWNAPSDGDTSSWNSYSWE